MDSIEAFNRAMAAAHCEQKVFDWEKAARLIKERGTQHAEAGLAGDWEWTGGTILSNGIPVLKEETYTYLSSNHATPLLILDGEELDCFRLKSQTPGWDAQTYWPPEALAILNEK
jgi:hypothetical protein